MLIAFIQIIEINDSIDKIGSALYLDIC